MPEYFRDEVNPKDYELRKWGYDPDELEPLQDFGLIIADYRLADVFIEMEIDDQCPKQLFFLNCLYMIVGNFFWKNVPFVKTAEMDEFLSKLDVFRHPKLIKLREQAETVISAPSTFEYEFWFNCGWNHLLPSTGPV